MVRKNRRKQRQKQHQRQTVNIYNYPKQRRRKRNVKREIPKPLIQSRSRDILAQLPSSSELLQKLSTTGLMQSSSAAIPVPTITIAPKQPLTDDGANRAFAINLQTQLQSAVKSIVDKHLLTEQQLEQLHDAIARNTVEGRQHTGVLAHQIAANRRQSNLIQNILENVHLAGVEQRDQILDILERSMRENRLFTEQQLKSQQDSREISAMSFQHLSDQNLESLRIQELHRQMLEQVVEDVDRQTNLIVALINNTRDRITQQLTADLKHFHDQLQGQITNLHTAFRDLPQEAREQNIEAINTQIARFANKTTSNTEIMIGALSAQIRSLEQQMEISLPSGTDLQGSVDEINTNLDQAKHEIMSDVHVRLQAFHIALTDMIQRVFNQSKNISHEDPANIGDLMRIHGRRVAELSDTDSLVRDDEESLVPDDDDDDPPTDIRHHPSPTHTDVGLLTSENLARFRELESKKSSTIENKYFKMYFDGLSDSVIRLASGDIESTYNPVTNTYQPRNPTDKGTCWAKTKIRAYNYSNTGNIPNGSEFIQALAEMNKIIKQLG